MHNGDLRSRTVASRVISEVDAIRILLLPTLHQLPFAPFTPSQLFTMGIKGLTGLLSEHAPSAMKDHEMKTLFGRKVAIDASM